MYIRNGARPVRVPKIQERKFFHRLSDRIIKKKSGKNNKEVIFIKTAKPQSRPLKKINLIFGILFIRIKKAVNNTDVCKMSWPLLTFRE
ncbi:MAG: hypothetical protein Q8R31_07720 [Candidatus Omnitrophota bacterium]|nr:hypothetical protein [Candidatus Omnitrophota bacterium]